VNRGGSWNNDAGNCRAANRNRNRPDNTNNNLGFRVCLAPSPTVREIIGGPRVFPFPGSAGDEQTGVLHRAPRPAAAGRVSRTRDFDGRRRVFFSILALPGSAEGHLGKKNTNAVVGAPGSAEGHLGNDRTDCLPRTSPRPCAPTSPGGGKKAGRQEDKRQCRRGRRRPQGNTNAVVADGGPGRRLCRRKRKFDSFSRN